MQETPAPAVAGVPETVKVFELADPVLDALGQPVDGLYVETFWLPVLGPTSTWLLRKLAAGIKSNGGSYAVELRRLAQSVGVGHRDGIHSPLLRSLARLHGFSLVRLDLAVAEVHAPLTVMPLTVRQSRYLSPELGIAHSRWAEGARPLEVAR